MAAALARAGGEASLVCGGVVAVPGEHLRGHEVVPERRDHRDDDGGPRRQRVGALLGRVGPHQSADLARAAVYGSVRVALN